jgi:hypothetical protein
VGGGGDGDVVLVEEYAGGSVVCGGSNLMEVGDKGRLKTLGN